MAARFALVAAIGCIFAHTANAQSPPSVDPYTSPDAESGRSHVTSIDDVATVDPFSGMLQVRHTDLVFEGQGPTIAVSRSYNTSVATDGTSPTLLPRNLMASGWDFHYGYVRYSGSLTSCGTPLGQPSAAQIPIIVLPDGSEVPVYQPKSAANPHHFVSATGWVADCLSGTVQGFQVRDRSGTSYFYTRHGVVGSLNAGSNLISGYQLERIEDTYGNYIQATYRNSGGVVDEVVRLATNDGRRVEFTYETYSGSLRRLSAMEAFYNNTSRERWDYHYDPVPGNPGFSFLRSAEGPEGLTWSYGYESALQHKRQLNLLEGPYGANKTITYKLKPNPRGYSYSAVATLTVSGPKIPTAVWSYDYEANPPPWREIATVHTPTHREVHTFCGEEYYTPGSGNLNACAHRIGKLITKSIHPLQPGNAAPIQTETYVWDSRGDLTDQFVEVRWTSDRVQPAWTILQQRTVERSGTSFVTSYTGFDNANLTFSTTQEYVGGTLNIRTSSTDYYFDPVKWIVKPEFERLVDRQMTLPDGTTIDSGSNGTTTTYTPEGRIEEQTSGGMTKINTYDSSGALDTYSRPGEGGDFDVLSTQLGIVTALLSLAKTATLTRALTPEGYIRTETDWEGYTTSYGYDGLGRVDSIRTPRRSDHNTQILRSFATRQHTSSRGSFIEITRHDAMGRVIETVRDGSLVRTEYDRAGRTIFVSDAVPETSGLPAQCVDPISGSCATAVCAGTCTEYDALGRVLATTYTGDGTTNQYAYPDAFTTVMTNAKQQVVTTVHERFGDPDEQRPVDILQEENVRTVISYYRNGEVATINQDPAGTTSQHQPRVRILDEDYRLILDLNPESGERVLIYDGRGRLATSYFNATDPADQNSITFIYDDADRIWSYGPTGAPVTDLAVFVYDKNDRLISAGYENTHWTYGYDPNGNRTSETLLVDGRAFTLTRVYDAYDHLATMIYPNGRVLHYEPDVRGRPTRASDLVTNVRYHPNSMVDELVYGNGDQITYLQDSAKPSLVSVIKGGPINLSYGYDEIGNVTTVADPAADLSEEFAYDRLNRLIHASNGPNGSMSIAYDTKNNRISTSHGRRTTTYLWGYDVPTAPGWYHPHHLESTSGDIQIDFQHDWRGNVRSSVESAGSETKEDEFQYDWMNRIRSHRHTERGEWVNSMGDVLPTVEYDVTNRFDYDAFGNRVKANADHYFVYSGGQLLHEEDGGERLGRNYYYLGTLSVAQETEDCAGQSAFSPWCTTANQPPKVVIVSPHLDARPDHRTPVLLRAVAMDAESGDLSNQITWYEALTSQSAVPNPTNVLGTGGEITRMFAPGEHRLEARVTDASGVETTATIRLRVEVGPNKPPQAQHTSFNFTAQVGQYFEIPNIDSWFVDPEGDMMTINPGAHPSWLSFDGSRLYGTPSSSDGGGTFEITAFDRAAWSAPISVTIDLPVQSVVWVGTPGSDLYQGTDGDDELSGLGGSDLIYGNGGNDIVNGGEGDDLLYGGSGNDLLNGQGGNDSIYGEDGDDILVPGSGSGTLDGGAGDDLFVIEAQSLSQTVTDGSGVDTLEFPDRMASELSFQYRSTFGPTYDRRFVRVYGPAGNEILVIQRGSPSPIFENVVFSSGPALLVDDLIAQHIPTTGHDHFFGGPGPDVLVGLAGNDILAGSGGDDRLEGGTGVNQLFGELGNDVYVIDGGVLDYIVESGGVDAIEFASIASTSVVVARNNNDLNISVSGASTPNVRIRNYYLGPEYEVESVTFSDGVTWNQAQFEP